MLRMFVVEDGVGVVEMGSGLSYTSPNRPDFFNLSSPHPNCLNIVETYILLTFFILFILTYHFA